MVKRSFKWLTWLLIFIGFALALLVLAVRLALPQLHQYTEQISAQLSQHLGTQITIEEVNGSWNGPYPQVYATAIDSSGDSHHIEIERVEVELDWLKTITELAPVFRYINVGQVDVELIESADGWLPGDQQRSRDTGSSGINDLLAVLSHQASISIPAIELTLKRDQDAPLRIAPIELELNNAPNRHQAVARFTLPLEGADSNVELVLESTELGDNPLAANYTFYAKVDDLGPELLSLNLIELPFSIAQLDAGAELWAGWQSGRLSGLQGRLHIDTLSFNDPGLEAIDHAVADFAVAETSDHAYQLTLGQFVIKGSDRTMRLGPAVAQAAWQEGSLIPQSLGVSAIDLAEVTRWFQGKVYLDESLADALDKLKPQGVLKHLALNWHSADWADFTGVGDLSGVSVGDYYGAPALSNINGRLRFTARDGAIDLRAEKFGLDFPELFSTGWQYEKASGKVFWKISDKEGHSRPLVEVGSTLINLSNPKISAAGRFGMYLPLDRQHQAELTLLIAIKNADGRLAADYVPGSEVGEELHAWIEAAVQGGHVNNGMLLLHTGTRSLPDRQPPTVQLYLDVEQAKVRFQPDWPMLENTDFALSLVDQALQIKADSGQLLNTVASSIDVSLPAGSEQLQVGIAASGQAADIQAVLTSTSLREEVGDGLDSWSLSGQHRTTVGLRLPLGSTGKPDVTVAARLANATFAQTDGDLALEKLAGRIDYSSQSGLKSSALKGQMWGQDTSVSIETVPRSGDSPELTRVTLDGIVTASSLRQWIGLTLLDQLSGAASASARLDLCEGSPYCNKLVVSSQLRGLGIDAPAPIGKTASEPMYFQLIGNVGQPITSWRYNLNHQLRGITILEPDNERTQILLGGERPIEPRGQGVWVAGRVEALDVAAIQPYINSQESATQAQGEDVELRQVSLQVGELHVGASRFKGVQLDYDAQRKALAIDSVSIKGRVLQDKSGGLDVALERLSLPESVAADVSEDKPAESQPLIETQSLPPTQVSIASLSVGKWQLGHWRFSLKPLGRYGLEMSALAAKVGDFSLTGKGGWAENSGRITSHFNASLVGSDLGDLLTRFGYAGVLEAKQSEVTNDFRWQGYPWEYEMGRLNGSFMMRLKDGRIVETGETSNILRLFGILNLNTVVRRLQLNFSDLVEKGVAFDRVYARYGLDNGIATTLEPVTLDGPSADVEVNGEINLANKTIDSQMQVVLPLTGNIPIAAVLLGAPQIAGAAFILDKLIGDKLEKVTTLQYRAQGSWDDPAIEALAADQNRVPRDSDSALGGGQ